MSRSPSGTAGSSSSEVSVCRRLARTAPRRWMPTSAIAPSGFFSTISWAIRTSVRRMSSRSSTTVTFTRSFLASLDRVKGADVHEGTSAPGGPRLAEKRNYASRFSACPRLGRSTAPVAVQHVRQAAVDDVAFVLEARLLHDPARGQVVRERERDDRQQVELVERHVHAGVSELGGESLAPALGEDRPPGLHVVEAGRVGVLKAAAPDHLAGLAVAQQPEPEAVMFPVIELGGQTVA